jgi:hypothetical protein
MIRYPTFILFVYVLRNSLAIDVCNVNTISAFARKDGLMSILGCLENARSFYFLSQSDVNNVVLNCLNIVNDLAPVYSIPPATQCSACYKGLISDLFARIIGTINSGVFAPTNSDLPIDCTGLTTTSGIELCLKNEDLRSSLLKFQKCSGYAVIYPASGTLAERRSLSREGIFRDVLKVGFGTGIISDGILVQVSAQVNSPPTPLPILFMQLCYLTFLDDLKDIKPSLSLPVISDCSSTQPSDVCLSDNLVRGALSRFEYCTGFRPDVVPVACSVDVLSKIYGNYDAMAALLPIVILNYGSSAAAFHTSIQPVIANIARFGGSNDCALCFQELAVDIAGNVLLQKRTLSVDQFSAYIGGCNDPHTSDCGLLIGTGALQNFQECSGSILNLLASPTKTPSVSAAVTTTSTTTPGSLNSTRTTAVAQKSAEDGPMRFPPILLLGVMLITTILQSRI